MSTLSSKYKVSYYLQLFFFSLIVLFCCIGYSEFDGDSKLRRRLIFVGAVFLLLILFLIFRLLIKIPVITIGDEGISFKWVFRDKKLVKWAGVKSIDFISLKGSEEGITVHLEKKDSIFISSGDYQNMPLLRSTMRRYISTIEPTAIRPAESYEITAKYAGNPWFSVNSIFIYVLPLLLAVGLLTGKKENTILISVLILFPAGFFFYGWRMFWFELSGEYLYVRNHYWFWYKRAYRIQDIETFVYQQATRGTSAALRIICKDFSCGVFQAGSLRQKHWRSFGDDINSIGKQLLNAAYI